MPPKTIFKYEVPLGVDRTGDPMAAYGVFRLDLPEGAEVLSVANQDGKIVLWALVQPGAQPTPRGFLLLGTGKPMPEFTGRTPRFIGTVQQGWFIGHLFDIEGKGT